MALQFGEPQPLDSITADDALRHPVWLYAWEAGVEDKAGDDTWQCPVTSGADVTPEMVEPVITLHVKGTHLVASACYNADQDQLEGISVWADGAWRSMADAGLRLPVCLTPVPSIHGQQGGEFVCRDFDLDIATRAHG